ncbi:hypothetical protein KPH14_012682 [Odynerus spinipes]|uniref:C2H2-type domain-containing protein n=1 Tax=Odynerus spinipes TaxID=1348599 RepID=A0AAD9R8P9_9HYME|nr:hypothetical protein KPH14_012682 [Odynerus spinipes]
MHLPHAEILWEEEPVVEEYPRNSEGNLNTCLCLVLPEEEEYIYALPTGRRFICKECYTGLDDDAVFIQHHHWHAVANTRHHLWPHIRRCLKCRRMVLRVKKRASACERCTLAYQWKTIEILYETGQRVIRF